MLTSGLLALIILILLSSIISGLIATFYFKNYQISFWIFYSLIYLGTGSISYFTLFEISDRAWDYLLFFWLFGAPILGYFVTLGIVFFIINLLKKDAFIMAIVMAIPLTLFAELLFIKYFDIKEDLVLSVIPVLSLFMVPAIISGLLFILVYDKKWPNNRLRGQSL